MKIELKKINHSKSLSEETPAYSAQVYVDGVHVCDVSNHGTGGPDMQRPARGTDHKDLAALDAKIKATYPKQTYDFGDGKKGEYETDLELLCHLLLDRADLDDAFAVDGHVARGDGAHEARAAIDLALADGARAPAG